jgi:hypothetical protein
VPPRTIRPPALVAKPVLFTTVPTARPPEATVNWPPLEITV